MDHPHPRGAIAQRCMFCAVLLAFFANTSDAQTPRLGTSAKRNDANPQAIGGAMPNAISGTTGAFTTSQDTDQSFQIIKTRTPTNYFGKSYAGPALNVQFTQDQALPAYQSAPGVVFNNVITGNGNVVLPRTSHSFWDGLYVNQSKTGDGSAQTFSFNGSLGAVGPTGYNEGGGFEGIYINSGSTNGHLEGTNLTVTDSPNGGISHYKTQLYGGISIVDKYDTSYAIADDADANNYTVASSGSVAVPAMFYASALGIHTWFYGIDLSQAVISSGNALVVPNSTAISSENAAGSALVSEIFLDGSNILRIGSGGNAAIFGGSVTSAGYFAGTEMIAGTAATTTTSGQVAYGSTTAKPGQSGTTCPTAAVLPGIVGCEIHNIAGRVSYIPYY